MFNKSDITRNEYMLVGGQARCGYDWWWHSFTGRNEKTGEEKAFFIEFFLCNMLLINYEAPNGKKLHNRLWNGGNGKGTVKLYRDGKLIDEIIVKNAGCEYGEFDKVE